MFLAIEKFFGPQRDRCEFNDPPRLICRVLSPYWEGGGEPESRIAVDRRAGCGLGHYGFAVLLHEFATNAAKYGALSGTPAASKSTPEDKLVLTWRERGLGTRGTDKLIEVLGQNWLVPPSINLLVANSPANFTRTAWS